MRLRGIRRSLGGRFLPLGDKLRESLIKRRKSSAFIPAVASIALKIYAPITSVYFSKDNLAVLSADDPEDGFAEGAAESASELRPGGGLELFDIYEKSGKDVWHLSSIIKWRILY
ncbi:MAG: hypothetical protein LBD73_00095 [Deferribacteraceae bacterium]|nr:hypothetical protein [Deferribacteraceae bacterium]